MKDQPYIVLAAGGTGGHMFPALSLAGELERRQFRVSLYTDRRGERFVPEKLPMDIFLMTSGSPSRGGLPGLIASGWGLMRGFLIARGHLKKEKPEVVVGFGGYSALPTMLAAWSLKIPLCIHEQNAVLGRANRLMAGKARFIALSFDDTGRVETPAKTRVVGNPVRPGIIKLRERDYALPRAEGSVRLLVMGGSQGARIFSSLIPDAISLLPKALKSRLHIAQHCREEDLETVKERYAADGITADVFAFGSDISSRLEDTHLVISRAGASTVSELGVCGRPAILVPLPVALDDHQTANARALTGVGGGWLLPEAGLNAPALANHLVELLEQPNQLGLAAIMAKRTGRPEAAATLATMIEDLISGTPAGDSSIIDDEGGHPSDLSGPERSVAA